MVSPPIQSPYIDPIIEFEGAEGGLFAVLGEKIVAIRGADGLDGIPGLPKSVIYCGHDRDFNYLTSGEEYISAVKKWREWLEKFSKR
jgi:hypothetical protein